MTRYSLNETFALVRNAARGAGLAWGQADECGGAARWLMRRRLPLEPLLEALERRGDLSPPDPDSRPLRGTRADAWLCPFSAGALLSDEARRFKRDGGCELDRVAAPIILAAFASQLGELVSLTWTDTELFLRQDRVWIPATHHDLCAARAERVVIQIDKKPPESASPADFPLPGPDFWERIGRLAARTYVPSGDTSRQDAGAGLTDND